jgi:hypothetical protein
VPSFWGCADAEFMAANSAMRTIVIVAILFMLQSLLLLRLY